MADMGTGSGVFPGQWEIDRRGEARVLGPLICSRVKRLGVDGCGSRSVKAYCVWLDA